MFAIVRAEDYAHGAQDRFGVLDAAMPLWLESASGAWAGAVNASASTKTT